MNLAAIVILNWNGEKLLKQFLPFVLKYTPMNQADIIIVDNGSKDNSLKFLQNCYPTLIVYSFKKNYGFAESYNRVLFSLEYKYIILLNSDVEVGKNWFCTAIQYLEKHQEVAGLQPKILSFSEKSSFDYAGASGGFLDKYGYPFCRGRILGLIEKDTGQYDNLIQIFWASGACFFIRLDAFKQVGGFDPVFFAYQEEIDLCWRLNLQGKKIVCFPHSFVYHVGGITLHKDYVKTYLNFRNNLLVLYKNSTQKQYNKIRKIRFFLDYLAALRFLLLGQWKNAFSIGWARIDFRKMRKQYRPYSQDNSIIRSSFFYQSIVQCYYLKNKKRWSDLYKLDKHI